MTEERNCVNCGLSLKNNGTNKLCGPIGVGDCIRYSRWQPITKPKVQMTEEEARRLFIDLGISESVEIAIEEAMRHGYIRKSSLVELVEEAEEMYSELMSSTNESSKKELADLCVKYRKALQALKKDHPEFGGKK